MKIALSILVMAMSAEAEVHQFHELSALVSLGQSQSLDTNASNFAPPSVELRYGYQFKPMLKLEAGVAIVAFPEVVPELRFAINTKPLAITNVVVLRDLYVRAGPQLLAVTKGSDWSLHAEGGLSVTAARVTFTLGLAIARHIRGPRLNRELRTGVGFAF